MAKTVSDVFLKLKVQGQETLEKLKSSFRGLEKTIGVTDQGIEQLRQETIKYAQASDKSIQSIRGQLDAFKGLRDQAIIGSRAYVQLTSDITRLTGELKRLDVGLKDTEQQAQRTFSQVLGSIPARKPSAFARDISLLNDELRKSSVTSARYSEILTEITQRTQAFTSAQARQAVIAAARPLQTQAVGAIRVEERLPNTTAALRLQLTELTTALDNADRSSTDYFMIQNRIKNLQEELTVGTNEQAASYDRLAAAQEASARRAKKLADIQEYMRTQGPTAPGVGGYRDPVTGAMIASGTRAGRQPVPVPAQVREISALYQQIGDIGMARTRGYIDAMGKSYQEVTADIRAATAASNGSINSLNSQRAAWTTLRNSLNPASDAYREVGREIEKVEKQLARVNKSGRMGRLGRNLAAGAGGMLSGGIFGGPEGAIGGLAGGLVGGAPGALAGAAIGAQVSQVRQQLAGVAQFNAELTLAKTTLAQASTGIQDYNRLLGLARQVSSDYAVSLKPAISGLAQVATAARANNLSFDDTEKIYRGLIASNVAFGKSQEDLDAIIRATVQVLSKGKVSAEELSGQIGERLPGAVAKFAAANDMTLPQLTKAFKDGQVTIAQFVRFAAAQGEEYSEIAEKIAEGPEKAGLRLQIALENSGEIFGSFFSKVGAGFQDFFTQIVTFFNNNEKRVKLFITNMVNGALIIAGAIKNIVMGIVNFAKGALDILEKFNPLIKAVRLSFQKGLEDFYNKAPERMKGVADKFGIKLYSVEELFPDKTPTTFGKGGGGTTPTGADAEGEGDSKAARDLERRIAGSQEVVRRLRDQLEISKQQRPIDEFLAKQAKDRSDFEARFAKLRGDKKNEQIEQAYTDAQALMQKKQELDLQKFIFNKMKGIGDMKMQQMRLDQDLNRELQDRKYELGLITKEQYNQYLIARERKRLEEAYPGEGFAGKRAELGDLYRRQVDPTFKEAGETEVKKMQEDLDAMLKPINQLKEGAMAFGQAFSTAFTNVITGAQSAQEAMGTFLKNLGQYFIDYAAKLITQMIAIATIQAVIKALGGPSLGATQGQTPDPLTQSGVLVAANGYAFDKGVKRYAMGGIVNKPTMFKYADGGTGSFGLMGEAGPEAIIPLRRGPDGRLGVSAFADSRAALNSGTTQSRAAAMDEARTSLDGMSAIERERRMERVIASGASSTEIKYSRVGSGDLPFVTEENMLQATRIAAQEGARLGQARTLAALKNNPGTRRTVGI